MEQFNRKHIEIYNDALHEKPPRSRGLFLNYYFGENIRKMLNGSIFITTHSSIRLAKGTWNGRDNVSIFIYMYMLCYTYYKPKYRSTPLYHPVSIDPPLLFELYGPRPYRPYVYINIPGITHIHGDPSHIAM